LIGQGATLNHTTMLEALVGLIVRTVPNIFALQRLGRLRYRPGHTIKPVRRGGGHAKIQFWRSDGANLDTFMMTEPVRVLFRHAHHCAYRKC
jgi:hypothetical protein